MTPESTDILKELQEWQVRHESLDTERFAQIPTKEDIEKIFHDSMKRYIVDGSIKLKTGVVATALVVVSITAILGGFKMILGWLGFYYIK